MLDADELAEVLVSGAEKYVDQIVGPLLERIQTLEAQLKAMTERGTGFKSAMRAQGGNLFIALSDGTLQDMGRIDGLNGKDGAPGKDADMDRLKGWIIDAAADAALPPIALDPVEIAAALKDDVVEVLRGQVALEVAAIPRPENGKDADPEITRSLVASEVAEAMAALPKAVDGKDADEAAIAEAVAAKMMPAIEQRALDYLAALPVAKDGAPGADGKDGAPGEPGPAGNDGAAGKSVDAADVLPALTAALEPTLKSHAENLIAAIPPPRDGTDGSDGRNGKDIDPERLAQFEASLADFSGDIARFKALPMPPTSWHIDGEGALIAVWSDGETKSIGRVRGLDGEPGKRGASMMDGSIDENGQLTVRMSDGRHITMKGDLLGPAGKDGTAGSDGRAGRDAAEIMILPGIDESRGYPAGTFANWQAGIIHADRDTDPVSGGDLVKAGWSVSVSGVAGISEEHFDDGRVIERTITFTGGRSQVTRLRTFTPIYCGIWRSGGYERGDIVTHGGSAWHCERMTDVTPGTQGSDPDWRLMVKRGRDGKEVVTTKIVGPVRSGG